MDKAAAITHIREHLAQGDIEAALQLLIKNLEPERRQLRELSNRAIQARAQLEKTQRDELQGIISFENSKLNYNQITQQVISLVDEWESPPQNTPLQKRKFTPQMILVGLVLLAFVGMATFKMIKRSNRGVATADACPKFEQQSKFNIMVLPFISLINPDKPSTIHEQIVRRLDRMKDDFARIKTSVKGKDKPVPDTDEEAIRSGQDCGAKLVIWGESEVLGANGERTIVTTNYKYLFSDEGSFAFTKFSLDDQSAVNGSDALSNIPTRGIFYDTITSLSSITAQGKLTGRLEDQFRLLFGVAIMQSGDAAGAIEILQNTEAPDSSASLLKDMTLAESHIQMGNKEAAKKDYDRVLEQHPNYWFALNNRALLYYQEGDYNKALETVEKKLQEEPDNVPALTLRGAVRIQTKEFKEAKEDLEKAERLNTDQQKLPYIRKKIEILEKEKDAEMARKNTAAAMFEKDRTDLTALTQLAESNRNLGAYAAADKAADQILRLDPNNTKAIAIKVETASKLGNTREANVAIRKVRDLDATTKKTMLQERPILEGILRDRNQR